MDEEVFSDVTVLTDDWIDAEKKSFEIRKVPFMEIGGLIFMAIPGRVFVPFLRGGTESTAIFLWYMFT